MILRFLILFLLAGGFAAWRLDGFDLPEMSDGAIPDAVSGNTVETQIGAEAVPVPPIGTFAQIVERPLFRPDRRPPAATPIEAPTQQQTPAPEPEVEWTLIGVGQNESGRVAILRIDGTTEPMRARVGDQLAGRIVKNISANEITLEDVESREIFKLALPREN